eukprot:gene43046-53420_t
MALVARELAPVGLRSSPIQGRFAPQREQAPSPRLSPQTVTGLRPRSLDCEYAMTLQYPTIADCVGNTPLVRLQRLPGETKIDDEFAKGFGLDSLDALKEILKKTGVKRTATKRTKRRTRKPASGGILGDILEAAIGKPADPATIPENARLPLDAAATSIWLTPPSFPYGGAGLVSSARDYDRFPHALQNYGTLDGVRVLKPET